MLSITSKEKFVEDLSDYIFSRVSGSHEKDAIIDQKPSRRFLIGTLAAKKHFDDYSEEEEEDQFKETSGDTKSSIRAQRQSVSVLIKNKEIANNEVAISVHGSVYYKIKNPEMEDSKTESKDKGPREKYLWKRIDFDQNWNAELKDGQKTQLDFSNLIKSANADSNIVQNISPKIWSGMISIGIRPFDDDRSLSLVTFSFENTGTEPKRPDNFDRTFFNCRMQVDLQDITVSEFLDEYSYEGHKQRYYYDFRPINCQAEWVVDKQKFITRPYGRFFQENIRPRDSHPGVNLKFSNLMDEESMKENLKSFLTAMREYLSIYRNNIPEGIAPEEFQSRNGKKEVTWGERLFLIDQYERLLNRIESFEDLINSNPNVLSSFLKTNEVFDNYYKSIGLENAGWRLFQFAFLLSSIQSVVKGSDFDIVDVLHVDTGGGKSEAYFGLVIFTSFFERINGKKDGVTAIVKFPLRMLSIQQLERISSIISHAEKVRSQNEDTFPGSPFSLGYYVGHSDEFPALYSEVKKNLYSGGNLISPSPESIIISKCPICPPNNKGTIRLKDDPGHGRTIHECDKCGHNIYIYQSDREVFRYRPTVIVSTVDKWAGLSMQRRARSLLGGKGSLCPKGHGFIPSGDICEDNRDEDFQCDSIGENNPNSSGPVLSIQDEMHLLSEGFGTISSHFEGLIENIVESTSNRKIKHIAMSATLNGTEKQIEQLYRKKTFIIPGRCPEGPGGQNDFFFEKKDGPKRIIFGLKPNLRDNHYAALRTLLHQIEFIVSSQTQLLNDPNEFLKQYNVSSVQEGQELINQYLVPLTYHIKKQDAYDMERLKDPVIEDYIGPRNIGHIKGTTLTGDSSLEDLKNAISSIKSYINSYNPQEALTGDIEFNPIFATSVVSHGVDVDEFNFMVFQGLPYTTSEYIQALSRAGRKNLGVIYLWFYPNRVRDDSFYRNFIRYHESLDHQVKPVPINRFARLGLKQTIHSLFCAGILSYLSNRHGMPLYHKAHITKITEKDKQDLVEFIKNCYGQHPLDINVTNEVEERIRQIVKSDAKDNEFFPNVLRDKTSDPYYRTQTGMRGIQKKLALTLSRSDEDKLNWRSK